MEFNFDMFSVDEKDLLPESNRFDDVMKSLLIEKFKRNGNLSWNDMCLYAAQTRLKKIHENFKEALLKNGSLVRMIEDKMCGEYYNDTLINETKKELEKLEYEMRYDFYFLFDIIHDIDDYDCESDLEDDIEQEEAEHKDKPSVPRILIHKKNDK